MFITYGRLFWCIGNVMVAAPTRAQLLNLRPGRDSAVVFPPRSEPDQWGEAHCPFPVRLAHETIEPNPPLPCATSSSAPAYKSPIETVTPSSEMLRGQTYTHHHLRSLLRLALTLPLRSHGCSTLPAELLPVEDRHGPPCRQRPRLHDHAHVQMDVP